MRRTIIMALVVAAVLAVSAMPAVAESIELDLGEVYVYNQTSTAHGYYDLFVRTDEMYAYGFKNNAPPNSVVEGAFGSEEVTTGGYTYTDTGNWGAFFDMDGVLDFRVDQ